MTILGTPFLPSEITAAALAGLMVWQWAVERRRRVMSRKVFCKDCKHYKESYLVFDYPEFPMHGCVATTSVDPVEGEVEDRVLCHERNANMDCGLFEPKEPEPITSEADDPKTHWRDKTIPEFLGRHWRTKAVVLLFVLLVVAIVVADLVVWAAERAGFRHAPLLPIAFALIWLFVSAVRGDVKESRER